jgi:hypothetical protein
MKRASLRPTVFGCGGPPEADGTPCRPLGEVIEFPSTDAARIAALVDAYTEGNGLTPRQLHGVLTWFQQRSIIFRRAFLAELEERAYPPREVK